MSARAETRGPLSRKVRPRPVRVSLALTGASLPTSCKHSRRHDANPDACSICLEESGADFVVTKVRSKLLDEIKVEPIERLSVEDDAPDPDEPELSAVFS